MNDLNNIALSRTTTNKIEISITVKVIYKLYKPGDIIMGDIKRRSFVLSNDIISDIVKRDDIEDDKINVSVKILNIKCTSGCSYFLAKGEILSS